MELSQCLKFTKALDQHGEIIFDCDSVQLKWLMTKCMNYPPNQMQHQILLHTKTKCICTQKFQNEGFVLGK
jgi:hypothetical protein